MKKYMILVLSICLFSLNVFAGGFDGSSGGFSDSGRSFGGKNNYSAQNASRRSVNENQAEIENNPVVKMSRGFLKNGGDAKKARNLLFVETIANYKLDDEEFQRDFDDVESSREYHQKMQKAMNNLTNRKMKDSKNRKVIEILNEAGDKLYNLLAN